MYEPKKKAVANGSQKTNYAQPVVSNQVGKTEKTPMNVRTLSRICGILAFITVVAVGFGIFSYMTSQQRLGMVDEATDEVVVAATSIEKGHVIGEADVTVAPVAVSNISDGSFTSSSSVVGRVAESYIPARSVIVDSALGGEKASTLAGRISSGKSALTVSVNQQSGVAGLVHQGDYVTIYSNADDSSGSAGAYVVADGVRVLAIDSSLDEYNNAYTAITVEVDDRQASSISNALLSGSNLMCVLDSSN